MPLVAETMVLWICMTMEVVQLDFFSVVPSATELLTEPTKTLELGPLVCDG